MAAGAAGSGLPSTPVLLDHRQHLLGGHVAGHDDGRELRAVPALEEHFRVLVLVRHVLDVGDEAHRRVLVGVGLEEMIALHLEELPNRVRAVLVVFAENRARFGLEVRLRVGEMLKHVSVERENSLGVLLRERGVVVRGVVAGAGVVARAGLAHDLAKLLRRGVRRAAEHQVLEEMRETRLARLDLVARPGLHRDLDADEVRKPGRDDDHPQAVGERALGRLERQDVAGGRPWPRG